MKILLDMNLSPEWEGFLKKAGWDCIHWTQVGDPKAPDREVLTWAQKNGYVIFTHDLDFGAILAATRSKSPSVFQVRRQAITPKALGNSIITLLKKFEDHLKKGALVTVEEFKSRVRILPIGQDS